MIEYYFIIKIVLALILGGIIGWQRVHWGRPAGIRTYALVTAGSTLFTLLSINSFSADTARVAAQIVTGIGFLGAGTILHKESKIEGLTTAAGLWMAAAIGMAVAVGYYILAIVVSILVLLLLMVDDNNLIEKNHKKHL